MNSQSEQLSDSLIAQLVEHCTGILVCITVIINSQVLAFFVSVDL